MESKYKALIRTVQKISASLDLDEVLDIIIDSIKELVDYSAAVIAIIDKDGIFSAKTRGYPAGAVDHMKLGEGIIGWCIATGQGQVVADVRHNKHYLKARSETRSELAVPITTNTGKIIGALNIESDRCNAYTESELEVLTMFAGVIAVAIQTSMLHKQVTEKQRIDGELQLARRVIEDLLPKSFPLLEGFDIYGVNIPVEAVGGDYFDYIYVFDRLGIIIADVSGKGFPAAIIMASFRAYMHATVINDFSMRFALSRVNHLLYKSIGESKFITAFYGLLDPISKRLLYINAGHNPPLLVCADGSTRLLTDGGSALGVLANPRFSEKVVDFQSGDVLVLYTDGVTEAINSDEEEFGLARLEKVVRRSAHMRAYAICESIVEAVQDFSQPAGGMQDDLTISVIKVK